MTESSRDALYAALLYGLVSVLWLAFCDYLLPEIIENPAQSALAQQISGYAWVLISAVLVFVARGRLLKFMRSDDRLQHQSEDQDRLRLAAAVFDSTNEGVVVTNSEGLIVHVNRAFMQITGYQLDEVLGMNPSKFKSGRHGPEFYRQMYRSILSAGQWSGEIWNRRKSGEIYPQWQTIRGIKGDNGEIKHFVAVFSDITAIKRSEHELLQLAHYDALTGLPNRLLLSTAPVRRWRRLAPASAGARCC